MQQPKKDPPTTEREARPTPRVRLVLSHNLQRLRESRGWSMERLANAAEIYRTGYSAVESAKVAATVDTLAKLSSALHVHVTELLREPEGGLRSPKAFRLPKGRRPGARNRLPPEKPASAGKAKPPKRG